MTIILLESDDKIEKLIYKEIVKHINGLFKKRESHVTKNLKRELSSWISQQPEIVSLQAEGVKGSLNSQFGLFGGQGVLAVNEIIQEVLSSVDVKIRPLNENLQGVVEFEIQPSDFSNILGLSSGFISRADGRLHWMDWLLKQGAATIVYGYSYKPSSDGVSGGGTMVEGGIWRVPPEYAGTLDNNFITRALKGKDNQLISILSGIFE